MPSVEELLHSAAMGRIGVDRRLIRHILAAPDAAESVARFATASREEHRLELDPLLIDLFRHFRPAVALDFYVGAIRRAPDEVPDELIEALLPFGDKAIDPLIALYHELGEESGADVAFLLAGLHVRDSRILELLLERLEYDTADGAFAIGVYGDPAARPALEKMLAEIPEEDAELRRELKHALDQLDAAPAQYEADEFDILKEYPERELPAFDLLLEPERLELLKSEDAATRAGAAHSFFNTVLNEKSRAALLEVARGDADATVRARAWESLADVTGDEAVRDEMIAVMNDESRPVEERGAAAVGLYGLADDPKVKPGIEKLYETEGGRAKALEAMWRSLWPGFSKFFPPHLEDKDPKIVREALRGTGYFELSPHVDKIAKYFDAEPPFHRLREDALFAYALAMPGETTRGRVRGMLRKLDSITPLNDYESELVEFALDERLRLHGLTPVFSAEEEEEEPAPEPAPASSQKVGRNDPCPCGSGRKYKKCHGA
jgi:HEAT repeat protein